MAGEARGRLRRPGLRRAGPGRRSGARRSGEGGTGEARAGLRLTGLRSAGRDRTAGESSSGDLTPGLPQIRSPARRSPGCRLTPLRSPACRLTPPRSPLGRASRPPLSTPPLFRRSGLRGNGDFGRPETCRPPRGGVESGSPASGGGKRRRGGERRRKGRRAGVLGACSAEFRRPFGDRERRISGIAERACAREVRAHRPDPPDPRPLELRKAERQPRFLSFSGL